jgi:hypothetical protein
MARLRCIESPGVLYRVILRGNGGLFSLRSHDFVTDYHE